MYNFFIELSFLLDRIQPYTRINGKLFMKYSKRNLFSVYDLECSAIWCEFYLAFYFNPFIQIFKKQTNL